MDKYIAATEATKLPGLPKSAEGLWLRAQASGWRWKYQKQARGRPVRAYLVADLPKEAQAHLLAEAVKRLPAPAAASAPSAVVHSLPAPAGARPPAAPGALAPAVSLIDLPDVPSMSGADRAAANARGALLKMIEQTRTALGCSFDQALAAVNKTLAEGQNEHLAELLRRANRRQRSGKPALLSRAAVYEWARRYRDGGWAALAPRPTHHASVAPWVPALLQINANPAKPNVRHMHDMLVERLQDPALGYSGPLPSYAQVNRFLRDKLGKVAREVGRRGPRDLANVKPHKKRLLPEWPDDVYAADGHKFDAFVQHWERNRSPLRPEITMVISVATRKIVGVSFTEDENTHGVLEAQRVAFVTHGVPAKWYVDNGPGFKNDAQHHEILGLASRLHFEIEYSRPNRPQGHGVIEKPHQDLLIRAAKELPSFIGKDMDKEAADRVYRLRAGRAKKLRGGQVLPSWDQFVSFVLRRIDEKNARPHRGLPKVVWPDGVTRHQSPDMAWAAAEARGWAPTKLSREEARDLFMPQVLRVVERGKVTLNGKTYFSASLAEYHGEKVRVGYDWTDPQAVVVRELETQRWICDAGLEAHAQPFFPESEMERARRKRDAGRLRRLQDKVDRLDDELTQVGALEHNPSPAATFIEAVTPEPAPLIEERPTFQFKGDRYEWLMAHRDRWREDDLPWVQRFVATDDYQLLIERWEMLGIAWKDDGAAPFKAAQ